MGPKRHRSNEEKLLMEAQLITVCLRRQDQMRSDWNVGGAYSVMSTWQLDTGATSKTTTMTTAEICQCLPPDKA